MPAISVYDRPRLDRVAREQFGVVGRSQALDCGLTRSAVDHRVRQDGPWRRLLPGIYATTTGEVTSNQRAMAALLHAGPRSVLTGATAVRRHRLRCAGLNEVDVLVPAGVRRQSASFVRVIHTTRMPEDFFSTGSIRFVPVPRAVADAARGMTHLGDVRAVVAEAVQCRQCSVEMLISELNEGPVAGSRFYRIALGEIGDGIRSAAEADLRELVDRSDLEKPMYNPRLYAADGTFIGMPDAWWQRAGVAAEVDSRQYHLGPEDHERTTMRHNRMQAHGVSVLHFLPGTLRSKSPDVVRDLRGAIKAGHSKPSLRIIAVPADG